MSAGASVASPGAYLPYPQQGTATSGMSTPLLSGYPSPTTQQSSGNGALWSQGDVISRSLHAIPQGSMKPEGGTLDLMMPPPSLATDQTSTDDIDALKASNESEKDVAITCGAMAIVAAVLFPVFGEVIKVRPKLQLKEYLDAEKAKIAESKKAPEAIEKSQWNFIKRHMNTLIDGLGADEFKADAATNKIKHPEKVTPEVNEDPIQLHDAVALKDDQAKILSKIFDITLTKNEGSYPNDEANEHTAAHGHVRKHVINFFGSEANYSAWKKSGTPSYTDWIDKNKHTRSDLQPTLTSAQNMNHKAFLTEVVDVILEAAKTAQTAKRPAVTK